MAKYASVLFKSLFATLSQDGRLFSLDNRRLYCFQECGVRWINVEMAETREGEVNEEYLCKRFGSGNGTTSQAIILIYLDIILFHFKTSQGLVLKMKPVDSGKNALAAVAALMPCSACNKGVLQYGESTVDVEYLLLPYTTGLSTTEV